MRDKINIQTSQKPPVQRRRLFAKAFGSGFEAKSLGNATTIEIFDEIGVYGVSAKNVSDSLNAATGDLIVKINSPGGDVWDGIAIHNELAAYRGKVTVQVTGLAASAASIIAMAGDRIEIANNAFLMIHRAWALTIGNEGDHAETAALLSQIDGALAETYSRRTGISVAKAAEFMRAETWFCGAEAVEAGFADALASDAEHAQAKFDLSVYAHAPEALRDQRLQMAMPRSPVELEKILRSAGLSRSQAKAVSFGGYAALSRAEPVSSSQIAALAERVASATLELKRTA
ncbi:head maturation protease, ClpP-related [Afipia felis]|uniref:ATP-dependent Clp protease proteolytic subunit n=2 Tax=Afipia felis TaxID=1035 RepID=A0A380W7T8_AFIFE|nr:head maturation protease, ClpP-related [Afipia felis]EKS28235.1 hypothetical protein HMPREF9697_00763 [Afipia felis ATCC 53690]SUU76945.1 ATP-dependent Clp protease proteolytic subunit [Afipia felis]SUU85011.1 ATP-dependent Clp protease proteolytic subunit [Afipia felis]